MAISWNLACALKTTPPFTRGFDAKTFKTSRCQPQTAHTADDGAGAVAFIRDNWQRPAAAEWREKLILGVVDGMSQALGCAKFPCHICCCCQHDQGGIFVPAGRTRGGVMSKKGQKNTHLRAGAHVKNLQQYQQQRNQQQRAAAAVKRPAVAGKGPRLACVGGKGPGPQAGEHSESYKQGQHHGKRPIDSSEDEEGEKELATWEARISYTLWCALDWARESVEKVTQPSMFINSPW